MKKHILVGITSGIAAVKIPKLLNHLITKGYEVEVIMTDLAMRIVSPKQIESIIDRKVHNELFQINFDSESVLKSRSVQHIALADWADICIIAPATANTIAKLAYGIADNFLTTTILATRAPILICPSMNVHMWENPVVQYNIALLANRGLFFLHPDTGVLACGYTGMGRLADISKIENEIYTILKIKNQLKGKKIIVTAGGTSEPIDPVRMITNKSSGKMGVALAQECFLRGANVLLLISVTTFDAIKSKGASEGIKVVTFETGKDLELLIKTYIFDFDVIIHNAAVSDYIPVEKYDKKIDSLKPLTLYLERSTKILSQIKKWNPKIKLIGFKAVYKKTDEECISAGASKLKESNSDFIVVNDVGRLDIGFGSDENEVMVISKKNRSLHIKKASKQEIAKKILDLIFPHSLARHRVRRQRV